MLMWLMNLGFAGGDGTVDATDTVSLALSNGFGKDMNLQGQFRSKVELSNEFGGDMNLNGVFIK